MEHRQRTDEGSQGTSDGPTRSLARVAGYQSAPQSDHPDRDQKTPESECQPRTTSHASADWSGQTEETEEYQDPEHN
jgi:hypothetical protein